MLTLPTPAHKNTMYFIGVTTAQSSIMKMFPIWADALGIDADIKGIDIAIHAPEQDYRDCVNFIKNDPLSLGALVTTHKIDMYNAAKDLFAYCDPYAQLFGELSSISKQDGTLCAHAKDPLTCGLAMDSFIPKGHFINHPNAQVCVLGAGGSALAISAYLAQDKHENDIPAHIHLTNRSAPRLCEAVKLLAGSRVPISFHLCATPERNDYIVQQLPEGSLVVNATGLGKDRPGSALSDNCLFPKNGLAWELNYRGSLEFYHQALAQKDAQNLIVEEGWTYFIHGWTQVIAEVFHIDITGERLAICEKLARKHNNKQ